MKVEPNLSCGIEKNHINTETEIKNASKILSFFDLLSFLNWMEIKKKKYLKMLDFQKDFHLHLFL